MKKILVAVVVLLVLLLIGGIYYLNIPKSGIKSIVLNEKTINLKKNVYDYNFGVIEPLRVEDLKVILFDEESSYEIVSDQGLLFIGDSFKVIYKNKDGLEKKYNFEVIDDLENTYLTRNVDKCLDDLDCSIYFDDTTLKYEISNNLLKVKVNGKGDLELNPINYRILSNTKFGNGVAFLYYNIVDIDDVTLYVLDNNGKVIFDKKILDEELQIKPYSIIGLGDNELVIRGNRVYRGFDLKDGENYIPMCSASRSAVAQIDYTLFYQSNNTVSELQENERYTVNDFISAKELLEEMNPCSTEVFE